MIYSLNGTLIYTDVNTAVVECGGVGFKCFSTLTTLRKLPQVGSKVFLYTHMNVREDAMDLYGFADTEELRCFKLLISVSGVGPKAALAILSELTPEKLAFCVSAGDSKSITRAQGVGPKTAQRVVLELKDKLKVDVPESSDNSDFGTVSSTAAGNVGEAISALVMLGYSQTEASNAVSKLPQDLSVEEMIKRSLRQLSAML